MFGDEVDLSVVAARGADQRLFRVLQGLALDLIVVPKGERKRRRKKRKIERKLEYSR